MDNFIKDLSTSYWWVSVVIVGLIINIISSFIFKFYETKQTRISEKKRQDNELKLKEYSETINRLVNDDNYFNSFEFFILNQKIDSVTIFVIAISLFLMSSTMLSLLGLIGEIITFLIGFIASIMVILGVNRRTAANEKQEWLSRAKDIRFGKEKTDNK